MNVQEAIDAPRFHHQWLPDRIALRAVRALAGHARAAGRARAHAVRDREAGRRPGHRVRREERRLRGRRRPARPRRRGGRAVARARTPARRRAGAPAGGRARAARRPAGGPGAPRRARRTRSRRCRRSIRQLDELFLLVVVGEFNAGKSAFINALLGAARAGGGRDPDHHAPRPPRPTGETVARVPTGDGARPRHGAGRAAARDQHRGHARHQRRPARARGADARVRAALRPRAVRDLRRPPVHGERARVPARASATGARRSWSRSTRSTSWRPRPTARAVVQFVTENARSSWASRRPRSSPSPRARRCARRRRATRRRWPTSGFDGARGLRRARPSTRRSGCA